MACRLQGTALRNAAQLRSNNMETKQIPHTNTIEDAILEALSTGNGSAVAKLVASKGGAEAFGKAHGRYQTMLNTKIQDSNKARRSLGKREIMAIIAEAAFTAASDTFDRMAVDGLVKGTLVED